MIHYKIIGFYQYKYSLRNVCKKNDRNMALLKKCPNTEFFLACIFPYSVQIRENTDQKKLCMWTLFTQCGEKEIFEKRVISCILEDQNFAQSPHFLLLTAVQNEKKKREEIAVI